MPSHDSKRTSLASNVSSIENLTLAQITEGWKVIKRNKQQVPFDHNKVISAVERCFRLSLEQPDELAVAMGKQISRSVVNVLASDHQSVFDVEDVQRCIIRQLWANGLDVAAEQYTVYREQRRLARLDQFVTADVQRLVDEDVARFTNPIQYFQFVSKFARWREDLNRRETWGECCGRVMDWFHTLPQVNAGLRDDEWNMLHDSLYTLQASCAMRVVQMAGPSLERCHAGVFNCAYAPIKDVRSFAEILYILMQGTGMGFSVENQYVSRLPVVRPRRRKCVVSRMTIPDTTEGWCNAVLAKLQNRFCGHDIEFDYSGIRLAGTRLKTKGGRASGPEPLKELIEFIGEIMSAAQGRQLTDLEVHDIACKIGQIVQVGGVRRASCISLSDLNSERMRGAKSGQWWEKNKQRTMANNSAVYETKPNSAEFMREWLALAESGSGERGIFNRSGIMNRLPDRRRKAVFGVNPCAEIVLRPYGFCNLSIAVARVDDTPESLKEKVRVATYFGMMQACATNYGYIRDAWKKNAEEERLLGVDITGQQDCPLLRYGATGRQKLVKELFAEVENVSRELSQRFDINYPAALTCVKPSGDSGEFFNASPGVHNRYSEHQIRTVRVSADDPVGYLLRDQGLGYHVAPENDRLRVVEFLKKAPEGSPTRNSMTAIEQLENWLFWQDNWAEHSVSCTIYVDEHEWMLVGSWCYEHFDRITGLSFMPKSNHVYAHAPNQELTEEKYNQLMERFPTINWAKLVSYDGGEDKTTAAQTYACTSGGCALA